MDESDAPLSEDKIRYHRQMPQIIFQGVKLPEAAAILDTACGLARVPEETCLWFWRFAIAQGPKKAPSKKVLRHAKIALKQVLVMNRSDITKSIRPEIMDSDTLYDQWIASLQIIIQQGERDTVCIWNVAETDWSKAPSGEWNPPLK